MSLSSPTVSTPSVGGSLAEPEPDERPPQAARERARVSAPAMGTTRRTGRGTGGLLGPGEDERGSDGAGGHGAVAEGAGDAGPHRPGVEVVRLGQAALAHRHPGQRLA